MDRNEPVSTSGNKDSWIKIVSDGTELGTRVYLVTGDGKEFLIPNAVNVRWECSIGELPRAVVEFVDARIDATGMINAVVTDGIIKHKKVIFDDIVQPEESEVKWSG